MLLLDSTPPLRFADGLLHGVGYFVPVHDDLAARIPGSTPDGLDQGALRTEEAFLVRIENGDQGYLGQVKTLPQ
ncbi:hypothetical protein D3C71_1921900 [compost metagenome]